MKYISTILITLFIFSGCATWKGVKKDSSDAWEYTKDKTNEAYEATKEAFSND